MCALVIPKEDGEMEVYSSTQDLAGAQRFVAQVTGVPRNRIVAKSKRLGGGFGGKETRPAQLTAITAVAAKVTKRAVRVMLERSEGESRSSVYLVIVANICFIYLRYSNYRSETSCTRELDRWIYKRWNYYSFTD